MAATEFALNDPLAVQRWSTSLAVEAMKSQYFAKFIGMGNDSLLVLKNDLHKAAGEKVTVALRMKLQHPGIEGDNTIEGHATGEEALNFFNDSLFINQLRKSTKSKGKMSEQRVPYNMRKVGRDALAEWWAEELDEEIFFYLSGARGDVTLGYHNPTTWTGRANNALEAPDAAHILYGGNATGAADMDSADTITLFDVERLAAKAKLTDPMMQPFNVGGKKKFVFLMHTVMAHQLRTGTTDNDWLSTHKSTDRGPAAKMYSGALGEYADVIMHEHRNCVQFDDYGAAANLPASRALFMGAQAGLIAYGQESSQQRYSWNEEKDDRGNALAITAGSIFGVKKSRFNSKDFSVIAYDAYCPLTIS